MKKINLGVFIFIVILCISNLSYSAYTKEGIENFPDSYKPYLYELQKNYPNWHFTALYTELDWNYVIENENRFGVNLVPVSYSDNWKNTNYGEYNVEVDLGWVDSSRRAVEFAMDPRNFLNNVRVFQFEGLSYDERTNNIVGIEKILYGTEFYNRVVQYLNSAGTTITMSKKYSDLILEAAKISRVSSFHLASRIKQEVGPFLSHNSISGTVSGYRGLYNFYNIGATSSSEPMGAIRNGLQYAKDGKGASETTKIRYLIPWDTKEKAITGGAIFIGASYINAGQNTIYLQKFHVNSTNGSSLFWHQYMTNVLAPYSEARSTYNGYINAGILDNAISFIIPVYNNMPSIPVESPNILDTDFEQDNTRVYANVTTTLNIRSGPSTSYEVLTSIDKNVIMTRIAKGKQAGELWDRVQLSNGLIGYVFHNYLVDIPSYISLTGMDIDGALNASGRFISGWDASDMTVRKILSYLNSGYSIQIYNSRGERLGLNNIAGTGSKIKLVDWNGVVRAEYEMILYGDVNGDGRINSIDLFALQRYILGIDGLSGAGYIAGNVRKNGGTPSSVDLFIIQRDILGIERIIQ